MKIKLIHNISNTIKKLFIKKTNKENDNKFNDLDNINVTKEDVERIINIFKD